MNNQDRTGFVKLYRSITQKDWYCDINTSRLYICLLLYAQWEDKTVNSVHVSRGSVLTSIRTLSEKTSLSPQQLRTAMEKLKRAGEITVSTTRRYSVITLTKWDEYQNCTGGAQPKKSKASGNRRTKGGYSYDLEEYENKIRSTVPVYHKKQKM
ncbi:MAG: hypothetical protein MJ177_02695 [Clostridia bacterium]|nr:hypothetical protein [Clostridia bacterium]